MELAYIIEVMSQVSYKVFQVEYLDEGKIVKVMINRPKAMNAMNTTFFRELKEVFDAINKHEEVRVAIIMSSARLFTAGLDLKEFSTLFAFDPENEDPARRSKKLYDVIKEMQQQFLSIIECRVPVLVGVHGKCIGGGVDLISMCDIRYCTSDAEFTIKQIDIGMAADLGTLQIMPNLIGNESTFRELAFTGRIMKSTEAKEIGLVSKVLANKQKLEEELLLTAKAIAMKGPVGIYTLKSIMRRQMQKKAYESMDYMARTNSAMLTTKDMAEAVGAFMQKRKPQFSKL